MNFFHLWSLFLAILCQIVFIYDPVVCDLSDTQLPEDGEDFFSWMFGSDVNQTDEEKVDTIKDELKTHYGSNFGLDWSLSNLQDQLDFHTFNLHDFDKNQLLDGLEMLKMFTGHDSGGHIHQETHTLEQNIAVIDMVLKSDDKNNDGFLDYNEFKSAKIKHNLKG